MSSDDDEGQILNQLFKILNLLRARTTVQCSFCNSLGLDGEVLVRSKHSSAVICESCLKALLEQVDKTWWFTNMDVECQSRH